MNKTLNSLAHKKLTYIFNHSVDSNESSEAYYYYEDDGSFTLLEKAYWNNNIYNIDWKVSISIKPDQFIIFPKKKIKLYFENCDKDFKTNIYSFNDAILYIGHLSFSKKSTAVSSKGVLKTIIFFSLAY